jgi:2,3-dihydroxybiphenyl 1,2-dioxygenase
VNRLTGSRSGLEVAYLAIETDDRSALEQFLDTTIGLEAGDPPDHAGSTWRNDRAVQRLVIGDGPSNDASALGIEALTTSAFDAVVERLEASGWPSTAGEGAEANARRVTDLRSVVAPWGTRIEIVLGLERTETFEAPLVPGGFATDGVGFGHVVFGTTRFDESHRFVTDGLGLGQSDWLETELAPGVELEVHFYHCNSRHHSIALARLPFELPTALHHVMFETNEVDDTGRAFDRALVSGQPIANGLGRHDNDGMFSFYVVSPTGFQIEVGHGARVVDAEWSDDRRYGTISRWGHQPIPHGAPSTRPES